MEKQFVKGFIIKEKETKYGTIIKIAINLEALKENEFNEKGWLNIDLKRGKESNKLYAEIDNYKVE